MVAFSILTLAAGIATTVAASTIQNLVVFGDSNSDVGNGQRWSSGPLWSEYLAVGWNASLYSFAYSGSVCDTGMYNSIAKEDRVPSLRDQLEAYYNLNLNLKPEETVYAFWFGVQDVFEMSKRHGRQEPDFKEITDCIGQQLRASRKVFLSDKYLVLNVPPLGQMPYYQESNVAANRSQASVDINRALEKDVGNLNKHHHALEMDYVDIHSLVSDMSVDPTVFGFQNPNASYLDTCYDNAQCKLKESDYIWWDKTHFTTAFHKSIAKSILKAESYTPQVTLTKEIEKQLDNPKSKFHSETYAAPPFKGLVDDKAKQYDLEKSQVIEPQQPPLEDDTADFETKDATLVPSKENGHAFIGLFVFVLVIVGIIVWIKFPNFSLFAWVKAKVAAITGGRDRGKFTPVRNEDEA
ncbi:GDSL family lipase [Mucor ambiguus]|uniref:GDSL family lipase n=1 Tax=Mucor ambiguus TaxID=91626 RepID=A0A0C9M3X8_9FUNG|nr:GDSL family lipase [Mucor ambiguus]